MSKSEKVGPVRRELPVERKVVTHKFGIAGHSGCITFGLYEDGSPGEMLVVMPREGPTISGLLNALATVTSLALQYGVPPRVLAESCVGMRFTPRGLTKSQDIPYAKSIVDYIFRLLAEKFLTAEELRQVTFGKECFCGANMVEVEYRGGGGYFSCSSCGNAVPREDG